MLRDRAVASATRPSDLTPIFHEARYARLEKCSAVLHSWPVTSSSTVRVNAVTPTQTVGSKFLRVAPAFASASTHVPSRTLPFGAMFGIRQLLFTLGGYLKGFITLGLVVCGIKGFVVESFYVPSESMVPTLQSDDFIVVPKFTYGIRVPFFDRNLVSWSGPKRGEVVVFRRTDDPSTSMDEGARAMVKRVIGITGDRVTINGSIVKVNGAIVEERYALWTAGGVDKEQVFEVPDGAIFVLGDNRDESFDSRFWRQPFVRSDEVVGPVAAVYWSPTHPDRSGTLIQ